jgi:hypothetical protein
MKSFRQLALWELTEIEDKLFQGEKVFLIEHSYGKFLKTNYDRDLTFDLPEDSLIYVMVHGFQDRVGDTCRWCNEVLPAGMRSDAFYCSREHKNRATKKYKGFKR